MDNHTIPQAPDPAQPFPPLTPADVAFIADLRRLDEIDYDAAAYRQEEARIAADWRLDGEVTRAEADYLAGRGR